MSGRIFPPFGLKTTDRHHRVLYRTVSGNVIGVVEQLDHLSPDEPLDGQRMLKIGVHNPAAPLDDNDTRRVIAALRTFVTHPAARVQLDRRAA